MQIKKKQQKHVYKLYMYIYVYKDVFYITFNFYIRY